MEIVFQRASEIEPAPWEDQLPELERQPGYDLLMAAIREGFPSSHPSYWAQIASRFLVSRPTDIRLSCLAVRRGFTSPDQIRSRKIMARLQRELGLNSHGEHND